MRRLPALVAALLLPAAPPLLQGTAAFTGALLVSQATAEAQSAEAIAKVAQAITVRIEGATQGSGVLVKRDGNRYTVLTAWHVVSGQRQGEELDIYTPDGQRHPLEQGSIKRLGEVDMAVLTFSSSNLYELAKVGDVKSISSGEQVLVAGFPTGNNGRLQSENGKLVANAAVGIDQGYQLLYTNDTSSGMSGGVVLKEDGTLIGMHGRGELDEIKSQEAGMQIKTGTNQGVPISYYRLYTEGLPVVAATSEAMTVDDYLAQARALLGKNGSEKQVIWLANKALALRQSPDAYFYRAYALHNLGETKAAIEDVKKTIEIKPGPGAYSNLCDYQKEAGDFKGAIEACNRALSMDKQDSGAYNNRGNARIELGDPEAITDYDKALSINPRDAVTYFNRGRAKKMLGDYRGAINDTKQSLMLNDSATDNNKLNPTSQASAYSILGFAFYKLGEYNQTIFNMNKALAMRPDDVDGLLTRGGAYFQMEELQKSIKDYETALAIDQHNYTALYSLCAAKEKTKSYRESIFYCNKAVEVDPRRSEAYGNRAVTRQKLGDERGACIDVKTAARLGDKVLADWLASDGGMWCRNMR